MQINLFRITLAALIWGNAAAVAAELTGREIMVLADSREDGQDRQSVMTMTLINKKGGSRIRKLRSFSKDYGKDEKKVMVFEKPADVKGTGFLAWDYDDSQKEDDRWLYMPALKKVRRISGSSGNDYFMGSDFTYDDFGSRRVDDDSHQLLREEKWEGLDCWVVESVPKDKEDLYDKKIVWVRKDILMAVHVQYFDQHGLIKILNVEDIHQVDGIWTAHRWFMDNKREKHQTRLEISSMRYNQDLSDQLFTVSSLERGRIR